VNLEFESNFRDFNVLIVIEVPDIVDSAAKPLLVILLELYFN